MIVVKFLKLLISRLKKIIMEDLKLKRERKVFGGAEVEVFSLSVDEAKKILEFSKTKEFEAKVPVEAQRAQLLKAAHLVLEKELEEIKKLKAKNPWEVGNFPEQVFVVLAGETRGFRFEKVVKTVFDWSAVPRELLAKLPLEGVFKTAAVNTALLNKEWKERGTLSAISKEIAELEGTLSKTVLEDIVIPLK
jgi:hypothetical protein